MSDETREPQVFRAQPVDDGYKQQQMIRQELQLLFSPPSEGSFPFSLSVEDAKKVGVTALYVAGAAVIGYILQTVIPGLHTDNPAISWAMATFIVPALQALERYLRDTRPAEEQRRLPYKVYKQRLRSLALLAKEGVKVDPDYPKK